MKLGLETSAVPNDPQPVPECCDTNTLVADTRHCRTNHCWKCAEHLLKDLGSACKSDGAAMLDDGGAGEAGGGGAQSDCRPGTSCVVKCIGIRTVPSSTCFIIP